MMGIGKKAESCRSSVAPLELLTPREREVLAAVAKGLTNRQTGELLGISHRTVEVHRARLMRKLEVESIAQLVALYVLKGLSASKPRKHLSHSRPKSR
jgi:DNA-binding CsgD family transcriptional regulator